MTDPVARKSLLPASVFPREQAIHDADAAVEDLSPRKVIEARDPITSPLGGPLEALAWEHSVDTWDELWPENIKRAAVIAAPEIHRFKGTKRAVKAALGVLKIDADVVEWWQTTPKGQPYTFTVKAYARARLYNGPLLDARLIDIAFASVMRSKPVSRAFDFIIGAGFGEPLGLAPVMLAKVPIRRGVAPQPATATQAVLALIPAMVAKVPLRRGVAPLPATATSAALAHAPVMLARVRLAHAVVPALPT